MIRIRAILIRILTFGEHECHTENMSDEKAAVIREGSWGHQNGETTVESGGPVGTSNKKMISEWCPFSCPAEGKMPHPFLLLSKTLEFPSHGAECAQDLTTSPFPFLKQLYKVGIIPVSQIEKERILE